MKELFAVLAVKEPENLTKRNSRNAVSKPTVCKSFVKTTGCAVKNRCKGNSAVL